MQKPKTVAPRSRTNIRFGVTQAALEVVKGERSLVELARAYAVHPTPS